MTDTETELPVGHDAEHRRTTPRRRWRPSGFSVQSKLLLMLLLTSVVSAAVVGFIGYQSGQSSLRASVFDRLTELRETSTRQTERQAKELQDTMAVYSRGATAVTAMREFKRGFAELADESVSPEQAEQVSEYYSEEFKPLVEKRSDTELDVAGLLPQSNAQTYLQSIYTAPYDSETYSIEVDDAGDGSAWSAASRRHHDFFRDMVTRFGYDDVMLIDLDGTVVSTAYRGVDLGTNILTGPYRESSLTTAFELVTSSHDDDTVIATDFAHYLPSHNEPVAWLMSPIGEPGRIEGVFALQYPIATLNSIVTADGDWEEVGTGATGEVFLAGPDGKMRTDSRLFLEDPERYREAALASGTPLDVVEQALQLGGTTLVQPVGGEGFERAQRGETGTLVQRDYLGNEVLMAYGPVSMPGVHWSIAAKIDTAEAFAPVRAFTRNLVLSTVGIIFLVCLASMFLARMFVRPLRALETGTQRISAGHFDTTLPVTSRDEFGDLTSAFNEMTRNLRLKEELIAQQRKENDELLLSLMPATVVERYREGDEVVAQDHHNVTVLFADIVGLDALSTQLDSNELLSVVNRLFQQFDAAAEHLGVERVRTMRSGYLASCGLNVPRLDNTGRTVDFAIEMDQIIRRFNAETGYDLALRAGIDTGPVSSGLVGRTNIIYDMWGSAVNLAFEAQRGLSQPGIYVTSAVRDATRESRHFVETGEVTVGRGSTTVTEPIWRLTEKS